MGFPKVVGFAVSTSGTISSGGGSHGSMFHRAPDRFGASAFPPGSEGHAAAGHMGTDRYVRNLRVVEVHADDNTWWCEERSRPRRVRDRTQGKGRISRKSAEIRRQQAERRMAKLT